MKITPDVAVRYELKPKKYLEIEKEQWNTIYSMCETCALGVITQRFGRVMTQKSAALGYVAAEACNHARL